MPVFDYVCRECGATYDVFHKVREVKEDVICPSCQSTNHQRLLSAPNVSMSSRSKSEAPACDSGGCCGGACGLN